MRLLSATVKDYRVHRDLTVDFREALTLVGGPNESGKSTLTEAIHRGLFLKSTIGGEAQREMVSEQGGGHPQVTVEFEAAGGVWTIHKVFSGTSGKATLSETGGQTLHGQEAEAKLALLLQVEEAAGGKGGANRAQGQWAHLWVWQGKGGEDPSEPTTSQKDALLSRLKDEGGGVVMQSDQDSRVVTAIGEAFDTFFTKGGKAKAGSDLVRALEEKETAEANLAEAEESFAKLEGAIRDHQRAEEAIRRRESEKKDLNGQLEACRERGKAAAELRNRLQLAEEKFDRIREKSEQREKALEEVSRLTEEIGRLSKESLPASKKIDLIESNLGKTRSEFADAEAGVARAEDELTVAKSRVDLAETWGRLLRARQETETLRKRQAEIGELDGRRRELEKELARLPAIDDEVHESLHRIESDLSEAEAVLRAMSTGIELIRSDDEVRAGETTISPGEELVIDRETVVEAGKDFAIRINPGSGSGLEEARNAFKQFTKQRRDAFRKAGVDSLAQAGEIRGKRQAFESTLREITAERSGRNPDEVARNLEIAERDLAACEAEIERQPAKAEDFSPPEDLEEARTSFQQFKDAANTLETALAGARTIREEKSRAAAELEAERERLKESAKATEHCLIELRARLRTREEPLGSEEERSRLLKELRDELAQGEKEVTRIRGEMETLQPDALAADIDRLERALRVGAEEIESARETRAATRTILVRDGSVDPGGELANARARAESAVERHRSVSRRADAIRLLRDRFVEEQQALSDRFSRPLADKVSSYLRLVFGPSADASVSLHEGVIGNWNMTRERRTFDFEQLSGGTREQVAAAVRLAIAEILAADHGGSLPVVFDDAFTHSDPDRIQSLQRMLDSAARNGLQIILLTCDPDAYAGLGAEVIRLVGKPGSPA